MDEINHGIEKATATHLQYLAANADFKGSFYLHLQLGCHYLIAWKMYFAILQRMKRNHLPAFISWSFIERNKMFQKYTSHNTLPPGVIPIWTWLYVQNGGSTLLQIASPKLCSPFPLCVIIVLFQMPNLLLMILWEASLSFWKDFVNWSCLWIAGLIFLYWKALPIK